jgi:hypothetical protein
MKIHVSERYRPGSIVCQISNVNTPMTASAIHIRPLPAGLRSTTTPLAKLKTNGAQGRIRTSVTRRVADLQSAAINHSATCAHPAKPSQTRSTSTHQAPSNDPNAANRAGGPNLEEVSGGLHDQNGKQYNQIRLSTATTSHYCLKLELAKGLEPPTL